MTHAELAASAAAHLATARTGEHDPDVAALCAVAEALLATRPPRLRTLVLDPGLASYMAASDDNSPTAAAARAVATALLAATEPLDDIDVDDGGYPANLPQ